MTLGERLKNLRDNMELEQKEVADKIGVKNNTLSQYENGKREPDYDTLQKLASLYNVTIDYLITGKERVKDKSNANLFFFDKDDLTDQDIEDIKKHIEYVKWQAKQRKQEE